jgi:hypothetical protein
MSIIQHLADAGNVSRKEFCTQMFHRIQDDERFLDSLIFSDDSMFHVNDRANTHNCKIWGSENSSVSLENVRDIPKETCFAPSARKK